MDASWKPAALKRVAIAFTVSACSTLALQDHSDRNAYDVEAMIEQERALLNAEDWQIPAEYGQAEQAAREGGLSPDDLRALLRGIRGAAGPSGGTFMVTVTDGGMVDMAQNMLMSLDAVPSHAPRLVVGMGADICEAFGGFERTTCVEVFRDSGSEDEVAWGSHQYWQVVFRKHLVLTVVATSNISSGVIYTDPDIVYLDSPVGNLLSFAETNDITFSPNNMLERDARSVVDLSAEYTTRGMPAITLGPHQRHVDINTGLFHMRSSPIVADLFLKTMRIFKEQEFVHGHYQQYSLVKALAEMPALRIGVANGDRFANGNVFWGHRELLKPGHVVSVHANWMQPELKRKCLRAAGFWLPDASPSRRTTRLSFQDSRDVAVMDERGATAIDCRVPR